MTAGRSGSLRWLLAVLFFAAASVTAFGFDVGALFNIGNLAFAANRAATDTTFSGTQYPWGVTVYGREQINDSLSVDTSFAMDPILRNVMDTTVTYSGNYFSVSAGPTLGLFNSTSQPLNPGISASVRVGLPGVVFLSYRGDSTLGSGLVSVGDYTQGRSDISLGYYVPNAICSANIRTSRYVEKTATGSTVDDLTQYLFSTDIFQKNIPYRVLLSFGYQQLSKTFNDGSTTTVDALGSLIIETKVEVHLTDSLMFIGDLNSAVYTFGQQALVGISNPGPNGYLFQLQTGLQLTLGQPN